MTRDLIKLGVSNNESAFTKEHTQIAKGMAILLMLYHHLFVIPERINCDYFSVLNIFGFNLQSVAANFSKICVCMFVFLSGFGLYCSCGGGYSLTSLYKKVAYKALRFLVNYWIIFLIFVPIGIYLGVYEFDIKAILLAMLGMNTGNYTSEWWFVACYIFLLYLSPCFMYLLSGRKTGRKITIIFIYIGIYILGRIFIKYFGSSPFTDSYFWYYENIPVILTFFAGMLCAKYNIYGRFIKYFSGKNGKPMLLTVIIISVVFRVIYSNSPTAMDVDFIAAPIFIFSSAALLHNTKLSKIFKLFGKHSTNMWLSHTFWCYYFWQSIVFLPYVSTAVYIWFVILSLLTSFAINILYVPINNLLFGKEHRLSYKGYL